MEAKLKIGIAITIVVLLLLTGGISVELQTSMVANATYVCKAEGREYFES